MDLTDDDLLGGDLEAIRQKIDQVVEEKVKAAGSLSKEKQANADAAMKEFAVFSDEDAEIREVANEMFNRAVRALPDNATAEDYKKAAEALSRKLAKLRVEQQPKPQEGIETPLPTGGGSAAAAHVTAGVPRNVEEAEALASKIASDYQRK